MELLGENIFCVYGESKIPAQKVIPEFLAKKKKKGTFWLFLCVKTAILGRFLQVTQKTASVWAVGVEMEKSKKYVFCALTQW